MPSTLSWRCRNAAPTLLSKTCRCGYVLLNSSANRRTSCCDDKSASRKSTFLFPLAAPDCFDNLSGLRGVASYNDDRCTHLGEAQSCTFAYPIGAAGNQTNL